MAEKNSDIIRAEIIRILNENGRTRGTELAKRVIMKAGNEKTVYREISMLVEKGEIEKRVHDRSHIEYELINLYESVSSQLKGLYKETDEIYSEIKRFGSLSIEREGRFHGRLRSTIHFINMVQSTDGIMRMLSFYPTFKKDRMFPQINRKIADCWNEIMGIIMHQPEKDFLNEVLANLRPSGMGPSDIN